MRNAMESQILLTANVRCVCSATTQAVAALSAKTRLPPVRTVPARPMPTAQVCVVLVTALAVRAKEFATPKRDDPNCSGYNFNKTGVCLLSQRLASRMPMCIDNVVLRMGLVTWKVAMASTLTMGMVFAGVEGSLGVHALLHALQRASC